MRKILSLVIALAFVLSLSLPVLAADLPKPMDKFTNGAIDVVSSPVLLYDHTKKELDDRDNKPIGLLKGLIESPFKIVHKAGSGALEMATFPVE